MAQVLKTKKDYEALQTELVSIEQATGLYLADESIDLENVDPRPSLSAFEDSDVGDKAYFSADSVWWNALYGAASMAAGQRAAEAGKDINVLLGRVIY